ncbi:xanthine dehydrogenase accessory protein XdhC [Pseudohoeflea suaedae]|uniref:Xanthine dehydrogenase accessory protein XdhC n=1 Tax=Pseudohoeflea suaedae TaxID=877384 RepID=A0A4R5PNI1_9HYPH|nr:xanthine dehydrogenase accessory protein XdhC [Pseudohoeflea suaedae]TDH38614.1 xanthine dehydrogenase accessory protein XdhC [Pseudohoeflea suaedae]
MSSGLKAFRAFAEDAGADGFVLVRITETRGSAPREAGAFMAVSANATFETIGGGTLEFEAIDRARAMLGGAETSDLDWVLGPDSGQCCGGRVKLSFDRIPADRTEQVEMLVAGEIERYPQVWIFGGGHVGRALAGFLMALPVEAHLVESREAEIATVPDGVIAHLAAMPESLVSAIAPGSAIVVLTHDHAIDFLVVEAALGRDDLAFIGMIGSKTKRATFESRYRKEGGDPARLSKLVSPIGRKLDDKRPEVIAVTIASELMAAFSGPSPA